MVVCIVSPASVTWKENEDGSSALMVAYSVSRASGAREDKPQKVRLLPWFALYRLPLFQ
jgi:hypothetical protein